MKEPRAIHVVGTGTIGEPLIGMLLHLRQDLGLDDITFHKHSPRVEDRPKIQSLMRRGAALATDAERMRDFEKIGLKPTYTHEEALERASVVIECHVGRSRPPAQSGLVSSDAEDARFYCAGQRVWIWQNVRVWRQ